MHVGHLWDGMASTKSRFRVGAMSFPENPRSAGACGPLGNRDRRHEEGVALKEKSCTLFQLDEVAMVRVGLQRRPRRSPGGPSATSP